MRRLLVALIAALTLVCVLAPVASAHRGSQLSAVSKIQRSKHSGHCGNGWLSYCYWNGWSAVRRAVDGHTYLLDGYFQERRGLRLYGCYTVELAGAHGVGWRGESCYRLK